MHGCCCCKHAVLRPSAATYVLVNLEQPWQTHFVSFRRCSLVIKTVPCLSTRVPSLTRVDTRPPRARMAFWQSVPRCDFTCSRNSLAVRHGTIPFAVTTLATYANACKDMHGRSLKVNHGRHSLTPQCKQPPQQDTSTSITFTRSVQNVQVHTLENPKRRDGTIWIPLPASDAYACSSPAWLAAGHLYMLAFPALPTSCWWLPWLIDEITDSSAVSVAFWVGM